LGQLDRRIVAEVNTLVSSKRAVTLVSVPTVIPRVCLDKRVRVMMPSVTSGAKIQRLSRLAGRAPYQLRDIATAVWYVFGKGPMPIWRDYFLQAAPQDRFDAIHCHDLWTLPAGVELRARYSPDAKIIYDSHELFAFQVKSRIVQRYLSRLEEQYIRAADLVITVNESISRELAKLYGTNRPEVIYNSCGAAWNTSPLTQREFLEHFGASEDGFRVMLQGNLARDRNVENVVRAFRMLDDSIRLFLLGAGPIETALRKLCRKRQISNVFFGRWVPQEDLLRYVSHANLGIIPYPGNISLNHYYCTPNKLFEFIEAGIPICANDLPELRRIIRGKAIGDVYPMDTPEEIAYAMDECRRRCAGGEFQDSSLQAAREEFSWDRQGEKLLDLYSRLGV